MSSVDHRVRWAIHLGFWDDEEDRGDLPSLEDGCVIFFDWPLADTLYLFGRENTAEPCPWYLVKLSKPDEEAWDDFDQRDSVGRLEWFKERGQEFGQRELPPSEVPLPGRAPVTPRSLDAAAPCRVEGGP